MTNFSENPAHVAIDFWKPESGKWYMTEMLDMSGEYDAEHVFQAVRNALSRTRHGRFAEKRWVITVLDPYHANGYPVMLTPGRASYEDYPVGTEQSQTFMGEQSRDGRYNFVDWASMYGIRLVGLEAENTDYSQMLNQDEFLELASGPEVDIRDDLPLSKEGFEMELENWRRSKGSK